MNTAIVIRGLAVAVLFGGLSPIACGSDSGGGVDTSKLKGTGGGATEPVDSGPPPPAGSVPCGEKHCTVPEGATGMPCCMEAFSSSCGVTGGLTGGCVAPPAPPPKECPPTVGSGFLMFRSCCTSTSICGVDTSMFGGGCSDYATVKAMAAMYMGRGMGGMGGMGGLSGMFMITLPDEDPPCTPPPAQ